MNPGRVVVVGGGIVGMACAHYLRAAGLAVVVLDSGLVGQGCSHANCGFVCPSHVLPLAEPGAVGKALAALLHPRSPFAIKPRLDFSLIRWFWRFARRCNRADMLAAGRANQPLLDSSLALYRQMLAATGIDCEWEERGVLFVFRAPEAMENYARTVGLLREEFGVPSQSFDGESLLDVEPALQPDLAGGFLFLEDTHLRPDKLLSGWRAQLEAGGVEFRERCAMTGLVSAGRRANTVRTTAGDLAATHVVVACGALTPKLNKALRCRVPIQPGKGYSITMARPEPCPRIPLLFPETRVAVTPLRTAYRLGSTMEFAGYDGRLNRRRLSLLRAGARPYLRVPDAEPVSEEWFGWRPMTPDSVPVIGLCPAWENVFLATGHSMLGLSMAPATGRLIAELVSGQSPHIDPRPYAIERFG